MPRKRTRKSRRKMRGGGGNELAQILTGEKNLQTINRFQKQKPPLQAPGNLAFPVTYISKAPLMVGGRTLFIKQRGGAAVKPHFGRYGDYLPPNIGTRRDLS